MKAIKQEQKNYVPVLLLIFIFGIIFSLVSFPNHYFFRTATLDLGLYTTAIYDYAHFSLADTSAFKEHASVLISDHFDLILMLISPLSLIFESWTLLIVQIVFLLAGGYGVYVYLTEKGTDLRLSLMGMLFFYLHFSLYSALSFDYHSNVLAASMLPWFFVFVQRTKLKRAFLILFLILICKENMALWMFFVCLGTACLFRREGLSVKLLFMALFSIVYFFIVTGWIMPRLNHDNVYVQFNYSLLGENYGSALKTIFLEPLKVIENLFINNSGTMQGDGIKSETWLFFLLSGGIFLIFRPVWIFMLIPVFLQKFMHDWIQMWGVNDQYVIEMAPVIALGAFDSISQLKKEKPRMILSVLLVIMASGSTIRLMDRTSARVPKANVRLYQQAHWRTDLPVQEIHHAISLLPQNASVSAQSFIHPHIAWRDKAYMFPLVKDAEFILYVKGRNTYPLTQGEFDNLTQQMEKDITIWKIIYSEKKVMLLKRN